MPRSRKSSSVVIKSRTLRPSRSNRQTASVSPARRFFLEGHNQAFAYFGGVPRTIVYNTGIAVKEITGVGERKPTEAFSGLQSHYPRNGVDLVP